MGLGSHVGVMRSNSCLSILLLLEESNQPNPKLLTGQIILRHQARLPTNNYFAYYHLMCEVAIIWPNHHHLAKKTLWANYCPPTSWTQGYVHRHYVTIIHPGPRWRGYDRAMIHGMRGGEVLIADDPIASGFTKSKGAHRSDYGDHAHTRWRTWTVSHHHRSLDQSPRTNRNNRGHSIVLRLFNDPWCATLQILHKLGAKFCVGMHMLLYAARPSRNGSPRFPKCRIAIWTA